MVKLFGGGMLTAATIGAFLIVLNMATSNLGPSSNPLQRDATQVVRNVPDAALEGIKETTRTIDQSAVGPAANNSETYRATKNTVNNTSTAMKVLSLALAIVKLLAKVLLVVSLIALVTRTVSRRRRKYVTYEIQTHRESIVSTEQIRAFMSATTNLIYVRSRRIQRIFTGSPSLAFRVLSVPNKKRGDSEVASYITLPDDKHLNRLVFNHFSDTYQDAELVRVQDAGWPTWGKEIVRNKKTRMIPYTIKVPGISTASESFEEGFNAPVMDKVVTVMVSSPVPAEVQFVATPVPRPFDRLVYYLGRMKQQSSQRADAIERAEGDNTAKASANEAHLFVEMRVGTPNYEFSRDIAAVLQGAAGGDAQIRERRPMVRKKLYQDRFTKAVGNPLPSWLFSVYSTSELSSLWQLPSAQLRAVNTKRHNRRRVAVPPEVHYIDQGALPSGHDSDAEDLAMWLSPERREIALLPGDFLFGVGVAGQQGMGKTVLMGRMVSALLSCDRSFSGLICDPKGDLAEAALSYLPPDRKVHYVDFDDPQIGINPFKISNMKDEAAIVNVVLHGIIDVARTEEDESQIMASSKDFLTMAIHATLATTVPFGYEPTFFHLRKWISSDPRNVAWRRELLSTAIGARTELEWLADAYDEYHSSLERSEAQFTTRAAAPMNKISELLTESIDRVLRHDIAINVEEVIRNNEIIIVNGRNHKSSDIIFRFLWQMADQTLGRLETERNKAARDRDLGKKVSVPPKVKFLFGVDEAPSIMTPTTAEIMARRRSAGLHMMIGWQHDAQIRNPMVRSAIYSLLQNVFQFRTSVEDARQRIDLFQMTYDDQQDSRLREIRTNRVSVADVTNLDRYNAYIFQLVEGNRVPAYWGWTIDPEGRASYAAEHLDQQKRAGGHSMGPLSPPPFNLEKEDVKLRSTFTEGVEDPKVDTSPLKANDPENKAASEPKDGSRFGNQDGESTDDSPDNDSSKVPPSRSQAPAERQTVAPAATSDVPAGNGNGRIGSNGKSTNGVPETAALDDLTPTRSEMLDDMSAVTNRQAGPGEDKEIHKWKPGDDGGDVGPLGQHLPGEIGTWLESVDVFRDVKRDNIAEFLEPPDDAIPGSVQARNEKARKLAADSKAVPPDSQMLLHLLYEFNVLTQRQMMFATGLARNTVSRRINAWRANGLIRGFKLGKQQIWTLTDLGTRVGRRISNRYGPLIPYEPGKGPDGKNEARRKWGPRNISSAHSVIHDLHLASWVCRFVELCDGDFRYTVNPGEGIIQKVTGEFGAFVDPPTKMNRRRSKEPVDIFTLPELLEGIAFRGIDVRKSSISAVHPDAAIRLHNLHQDKRMAKREIWIELDRQGHTGRLEEKLQAYDVFMATWWQLVPRFASPGVPPVVIFVASSIDILKRELAVADRTLLAQAGPRRDGPKNWPNPPARNRIYFAVESDLHKGSTRVYRVPEETPTVRLRKASNDRERAEAANCHPRINDQLLPQSLMAGRRDGTHEPPLKREV